MTSSVGLYTPGHGPDLDPQVQVLRLASGHITAQAVYVFTALGVPDVLADGPKDAKAIAEAVKADASSLYRLLRFLATTGLVTEDEQRRFGLTRVGSVLRSRATRVIRDNTLLVGSEPYWMSLGNLLHNVRTGETAFRHHYGQDFFDYLAAHPEHSTVFNAAMDSSSNLGVAAIVAAYDFSLCRNIVDIAGGKGALLKGILRKYPQARGILFDADVVLAQAKPDESLAARMSMVPGSFFGELPASGDLYILRRILHNWPDERAVEILRNCRKAMPEGARLLIIELAAAEDNDSRNNWAALDLLMMILMDGRERTAEELENLLAQADFRLSRIIRTNSPYWIVEAMPA